MSISYAEPRIQRQPDRLWLDRGSTPVTSKSLPCTSLDLPFLHTAYCILQPVRTPRPPGAWSPSTNSEGQVWARGYHWIIGPLRPTRKEFECFPGSISMATIAYHRRI